MAPTRTEEDGFDKALKQVPVTEQRRPFIWKDGDERLTHTGELFGKVFCCGIKTDYGRNGKSESGGFN